MLKKIEATVNEIRTVVNKSEDTRLVIDETPVFDAGNPSSHDGKKPDLVDEQKKEWFLKEGEGMNHLKWRAKSGSKDDEPEFNT